MSPGNKAAPWLAKHRTVSEAEDCMLLQTPEGEFSHLSSGDKVGIFWFSPKRRNPKSTLAVRPSNLSKQEKGPHHFLLIKFPSSALPSSDCMLRTREAWTTKQ